jgi:hypothetical protein
MAFAMVAQTTVLKIILFCIAGFFAFIMFVNLLRGQTCRSFLRTMVQIEQLWPLCRVRRAQKVFIRVRPLIAAAQGGELSPHMISNMMRNWSSPGILPRLDF